MGRNMHTIHTRPAQEDLAQYGRDELILAALAAAGGTAPAAEGDDPRAAGAGGGGGGLCWRVQGHAQRIEADLRRVRPQSLHKPAIRVSHPSRPSVPTIGGIRGTPHADRPGRRHSTRSCAVRTMPPTAASDGGLGWMPRMDDSDG
jgi:hypothetical protein